jgi:hypothetical protein
MTNKDACGFCGRCLSYMSPVQACPRCGTVPPDPREEALRVLHRELTPVARGALAHLLNNALCPLVTEVAFLDAEVSVSDLRAGVAHLTAVVRDVLSIDEVKPLTRMSREGGEDDR